MAWKTVENDEYESSAPAVQAHFHAVRAEEAFKHSDVRLHPHYIQAEKEGHLASERFLQAAQRVTDKRTIGALVLLAENYEYRAKVARARNPSPVETDGASATTPTAETAAAKENSTKTTPSAGVEKEGERLMEQQYGGRAPVDPRRSNNTPRNGNSPPGNANSGAMTSDGYYRSQERQASSAVGKKASDGQEDVEGLQETITRQKYEIVRLLNVVKTLSSENTKLVKVRMQCDAIRWRYGLWDALDCC
ncbi:hypothetical protein BBJ28_00001213 [Nothophytophthora sp. Chile5]|nr:hypothetical protein BBJ28_00001213 [Nothophytophthora sp. Chile5]